MILEPTGSLPKDTEKLARAGRPQIATEWSQPPPAYDKVVEPNKDTSSAASSFTRSPVVSSRSSSPPLPPIPRELPSASTTAVNGLVLSSRKEDIFGTWNIDPSLPRRPGPPTLFNFGRKHGSNPPNVSLSSRRGSIMVRLAIVGPSHFTTKVQAVSRSGSIHIDVFAKSIGKNVNLNTYTRKGDTVILLPRDFVGVVELRSRRGHVDVLPTLAQHARVLRTSAAGALVLIGNSKSLENVQDVAAAAKCSGDYGLFASKRGRVKIGFSGEDTTLPPEPGFWHRLGSRLLGR